ncbi:ankyrin repeat-containing domain protein [Mycena polygramma]|nr:ankyrin repeat-containing domain protein [Mycena polygramma]
MVDPLSLTASILQLIDTVANTRDHIEDFRNAPHDQRQLLEEAQSLSPLIQELKDRIEGRHAVGLTQSLETPLQEVEEVLKRLMKKLNLRGISKFSGRVTWSLWGKEDVHDGLEIIERFKSLLNSWLGVDISAKISDVAQEQRIDRSYMIRSLASSSKAQKGYHEHTVSLLANATEEQQVNHHYLSTKVSNAGKQQEHFHTETISLLESTAAEQQINHHYLSTRVRNAGKQQEHLHDRTISRLENVAEKQETRYNSLFNSVRDVGKSQEQYHTTAERDKMIEWYSPLNMFLRQADISSKWEPGTGLWLLENMAFRRWKSGTGQTLWCQGIPGAGKTVLASLIMNTLRLETESQNIGVGVIYLEYRETDVPSPSRLLAALWRQLVIGKPISPVLEHLYGKHREPRTRPTIAEDDTVLRSIIPEYSKVFILVDGLDEYPEKQRDILLAYICAWGPSVNLLLTSRPHITIGHIVSSYGTIEIQATEDDIRKYLDSQISKSSRLSKHLSNSPALHQELEATVVERSDGMFLLAKLHVDSLTEKRTVREIRDALDHMADDLDVAYGAVVDRINRQSQGDRQLAWRTLSWIAHAKRPLRRSELIEALAVEPGAMALDPDNLPEIGIVLSVCAGLVVINEEDDKIRLIHYTTELFLRSPHVQAKAFPLAQTEITMTCLTYLSLGFEAMADRLQEPVFLFTHNPFLHYAADYCLIHARGEPELQIKAALLSFLSKCSVWRRLWMWKQGSRTLTADRLWIAAVFRLEATCRHIIDEAGEREGFGALLHQATLYGSTDVVRLLLKNGFGLQAKKQEYCGLALLEASRRGYDKIVSLLVDHIDIGDRGQDGTALQMADFSPHTQSIHGLIESANSDPGCCCMALCAASEEGHEEVVRLLIEHGADINADGGQALKAASKNGKPGIVSLLIREGADINANGGCALRAASETGNAEVVKLLIEAGADVDANEGYALWSASQSGSAAVVKLLIEAGADVNAKNGWAFRTAAKHGDTEIVKLFIAAGISIGNIGPALGAALEGSGNTKVIRLLVESRGDITGSETRNAEIVELLIEGSINTNSGLRVASADGSVALVKLLIEAGADVNANSGQALSAASEKGNTNTARLLIEAGANVNANSGEALIAASERGNTEIVKVLLAAGADVDANSGRPLRLASERAKTEVVKLLIEAGADVDSNNGRALRAASKNGNAALVKLLIAAGAGLDVCDHWGSALYYASYNQNTELVKLLIDAGADVNVCGCWGSSALCAASSKDGNAEVVKLLVDGGADVNAQHGRALWLASRSGNAEVVKLLFAGGATINPNRGLWTLNAGDVKMAKPLIEARADVHADNGGAVEEDPETVKLAIAAGAKTVCE